jgi:hypothetical protein
LVIQSEQQLAIVYITRANTIHLHLSAHHITSQLTSQPTTNTHTNLHTATMSADLVIRSLSPAITIFSIPFSRFGLIPFGGRSTAIKLKNDEVFVVVSSPCDEPTTNAINAMGTVK